MHLLGAFLDKTKSYLTPKEQFTEPSLKFDLVISWIGDQYWTTERSIGLLLVAFEECASELHNPLSHPRSIIGQAETWQSAIVKKKELFKYIEYCCFFKILFWIWIFLVTI